MPSLRSARHGGRLTPATVLALIALSVSLGGTAYGARGLITGADIKDGTITSRNIRKGSLNLNVLNVHAREALSGRRGPQGPSGATGPQGPAAHTPFEAQDVTMSPGDSPRTIATEAGVAIAMSCTSVSTPGWAWGTAADVTATTDIGRFSLANGLADQMLNGTNPDPSAIFPYDFTGTFIEYWNSAGSVVRSYGHLSITQHACELSDFRGVVFP